MNFNNIIVEFDLLSATASGITAIAMPANRTTKDTLLQQKVPF
jgi:hypothetical protein